MTEYFKKIQWFMVPYGNQFSQELNFLRNYLAKKTTSNILKDLLSAIQKVFTEIRYCESCKMAVSYKFSLELIFTKTAKISEIRKIIFPQNLVLLRYKTWALSSCIYS